ncbi:FimV/HubP family polar landmark protein [Shewanella sp. SP2S2-4]|uniref:FimV/HubP family polar landmark protein n=1 Tax=Shewanella sp. SP2S2-4 TaxID=3063539 RepID=UPI00289213A9|nr:FimV/HubP family polar landmark protein [Shewanella sp. SP2S2-4]MDT3274337.1 FimV/HubP family polar landmark protein [Shewanella sp. SP2S2-4]
MKFRTSYLVGLMATVLAVSSTAYFIDPAVAADTPRLKPLKIMGPDGQIRQVNHQYGPTTSRDTFWSIAQKVRPDASVSVYQVMAALYDANPHAFNSSSYNSLERGMILLIPSKEVMLSIPNSMAIARAEQSDRQSRAPAKAVQKPAAKVTTQAPVTAPAVIAETKITETKVTPPKAPVVETPTPDKPKMLSSDVTSRLEAAESKNLSLTDELARTQDQLTVRTSDVEALKVKVEELNQRIAVLEETLQASKLQNQALKAEVEAAQMPEMATDTPEADAEVAAEPDDLWRNILNSPVLMIAAAVIPALFLLLAVFWFLRRKRNKERREMQAQEAVMAAGAAGVTGAAIMDMDDDDLDDMAVHLDTDHADSIDSLLDMGSVDLQPEQDLTDSNDQMDMASEMFVDPGLSAEPEVEDEGQSLDDLWAEAMGDQEEDIVEEKPKSDNILEEADLDALLAGLGSEDSTSEDSAEAEEDLSELERNFASDLAQEGDSNDITSELNDVEAADTKPADEAIADDDDLDALLAEFSVPAEDTEIAQAPDAVASDDEDLSAAIAAELNNELDDELGSEEVDDIDALLADFDKPAEPEVELDELGVEDTDDIDALLADFDKPAEPEVEPDLGAEIAAELDAELDELGVEDTDDIDALLADFDKPAEPEAEPDLGAEIAAELDAELDELGVEDTDDIDALLADFDKPAEPEAEPDLGAEIAAELDDELDELGVDESDDIDSLLASFDAEPEIKVDAEDNAEDDAQNDTEDDAISAEIAAELEASLPEDIKGEAAGDEDLDALLAEFDVPEQLDADEDEFDFDMETAQLDADDNATDEDNLLKGIGASHSIDGTDDTFSLVEELGEDDDSDALTTAAATLAAATAAASVKEKESSFFNDLKANKSKDPHVLDWDSELDFAPKAKPAATPADAAAETDVDDVEPNADASLADTPTPDDATQEKPIKATRNDVDFSEDFKLDTQEDADYSEQGLDLSDDNVLAAFTANTDFDDDEDVLTSEDSFSLVDDLTVDEALAALDAQESRKAQKKFVPEHDLTNFQNENGFIDIDKLLNDADEDGTDTDLYSEVDVEMSDVGALIGDAAMIDVDDEENSVNAKLDLARAYIEIDDSDSAKALLKEVQIDGNERQQDEAGRLLKEMS